MIDQANFENALRFLNFEENNNVFSYRYDNGVYLKADFNDNKLIFPEAEGLVVNGRQTCNFSQNENFVVFECVHRLLAQGYKPEHIELERKWQVGHGASGGRADILIKDNHGDTLLIIECKTAGSELKKAWNRTLQDGGQLFSYVKQTSTTQFVCLYASNWIDDEVKPEYYLISLNDNEKLIDELNEINDTPALTYTDSKLRAVEDIFNTWKDTYELDYATRGLFEDDIQAYHIGKENYSLNDLNTISSSDIQGKYNEFATILRQHNVSGRENAFDKLVNLFLCKIVDETNNPQDLKFQWKGISYDSPFDLQDRLQALYQQGMKKFLDEEVTYVRDDEVEKAFRFYRNDPVETQKAIKGMFRRLKFFTNNDFAFIDVHNERLFQQNSAVLLKIVKMLQDIRLKTEEENQFLGDMFEGFLDQGVKQSEGQFFTPMPIVKFIMSALPLDVIIKTSNDIPKVIDYACGAGHFLNEYATSIRPVIENDDNKNLAEYYSHIIGIEKEYRLSKVAKVSAFMYGQDDINIIYADALGSNDDIKNNSYSVLVANPPYSVKGFLDTLKPSERRQYELLKYIDEKNYTVNNSIETFFIERAKQLLKTDGVAAIIVPSSILTKGKASSTSTSKSVYVATREILLKYFDIVAIAEFGSGTFGKTGTNTVTLFLRRKTTYAPIEADHYAERVNKWFNPTQQNNPSTDDRIDTDTVFADSHFINEYCAHLDLNVEDYKTLLAGAPNKALLDSEYFTSYVKEFDKWSEIKNLKKRKSFKVLTADEKKAELNRRLVDYLKAAEKDKFYYFVLASRNPQPVLIIKSPSKTKDIKAFLGYEWSSAKGSEGIKYLGGAQLPEEPVIDEDSGEVALEEEDKRVLSNLHNLENINTPLYNPKDKTDVNKINHLISQNFEKKPFDIPEELAPFVTKARLVDMLDFSVVDFNKAISLTPREDIKVDTKWDVVKISDIGTTSSGGTPKSDNYHYYTNGTIPWLNSGEVRNGLITSAEKYITEQGLSNSSAKIFPINTVLVAMYGATAGQVGILKFASSTNQAVCGIITNDKCLPMYLFYYLSTQLENLLKLRVGVARLNLSQDIIQNSKIPLPPIDIQEKIINDCQKVDDEVEKAKENISNLENEISNILNATFDANKKLKINELIDINTDSYDPTSDNSTFIYVDIDSVEKGTGVVNYSNEIQGNSVPSRARRLAKNHSTIISTVRPYLKGFAYIKNQPKNVIFSTGFAILKSKNTEVLLDKVIYYYFMYSENLMKQMEAVMPKAAYPSINKSDIDNFKIALPDIKQQKELIESLDKLKYDIQKNQAIVDKSTDKKHAIIQSYL